MEKLSHVTESIINENVERLAALFPEVVTEVRGPDGSLRHTIDVDALRERVGDVAEGQRERYQFTWPGKREAKQEAYRQIDKCLRPCQEESVNWDTTQNLYIEGDNLDALKLLRNTYAGKVKMIYIDPPYNTGHDFIYDDDFAQTKADYDAESGDYDEEGGRLVANPESNGRFHSDWCSMMYPRLLLARDLLSEDGALFISIDDAEVDSVKKIMAEVFGSQGFVGLFCRKTKSGGGSASGTCAVEHDYVLVFAKSNSDMNPLGQRFDEKYLSRYKECDEMGRFFWDTMERSSTKTRPYLIEAPDGTLLSGKWFRSEETFKEDLKNGEVRFLKKSNGWSVQFKQRLAETKRLRTILETADLTDKKYRSLTEELYDIVDCSLGHPPKPLSLMKTLIYSISRKEDIILDFFSGSATTAHAVMQLNAEDGGNRRFIMVQLPEVCDERSEAAKAGYKNICEIGKERIRRAGRKIAAEVEEQNRQPKLGEEPKKVPDIGFRVLKIDSSNFEDVSAEPAEYTQQTLAGLADNLKPGRTAEDLLFQVMLQFQIPLSAKIEKCDVNGSGVFSVDDGRLVACFDRNVATETIVAMAKLQPDYAVMRDASFTGDDAVSNFGELFKTYSSATITRVV